MWHSPKLRFHCLVNWTCYHSLFTMSTKYSDIHTAHSLNEKVKFANMQRKRLEQNGEKWGGK